MPTPRWRPISADASRARPRSPSCASSVTSAPVISRPDVSARPSAESGSSAAIRRRLARERRPRRRASRGSRGWGSRPGTAGRSSSIDHVAELGAGADRAAVRARRRRPARRRSPVPIVSSDRVGRAPCAAPARCSASTATFASLSTSTGSPSRSRIRSRNGTSASGRFTAIAATPRRWSIRQGIPKPTAATSRRRGGARLLDRLARPQSRSAAVSARCTERAGRGDGPGGPRRRRPASSFVPPRSTPITHSAP